MGKLIRAASIGLAHVEAASIARLVDAGFRAIDISIPCDDQLTGASVESDLRRVGGIIEGQGAGIASVTLSGWVVGPSDRGLGRYIRTAAEIGASVCILTPAAVVSVHPTDRVAGYTEVLNAVAEGVQDLFETAERCGVVLAVRAPFAGALLSPVEVRELVDSVGTAWVGVCVDVESLVTIGRAEDWLKVLGRRVAAVRVGEGSLSRLGEQIEACAAEGCVAILGGTGGVE